MDENVLKWKWEKEYNEFIARYKGIAGERRVNIQDGWRSLLLPQRG